MSTGKTVIEMVRWHAQKKLVNILDCNVNKAIWNLKYFSCNFSIRDFYTINHTCFISMQFKERFELTLSAASSERPSATEGFC